MKSGSLILILVIAIIAVAGIWYFAVYSNESPISSDSDVNSGDTDNGIDTATGTGGNDASQESEPTTYNIEIKGFAYSPSELRIKRGDIVTWTNKDSIRHTVTSDSGSEMDSELLSQGETYSATFDSAGNYAYHCTPHPSMKARIIVE